MPQVLPCTETSRTCLYPSLVTDVPIFLFIAVTSHLLFHRTQAKLKIRESLTRPVTGLRASLPGCILILSPSGCPLSPGTHAEGFTPPTPNFVLLSSSQLVLSVFMCLSIPSLSFSLSLSYLSPPSKILSPLIGHLPFSLSGD